jgi:hypothetical protein
MEDAAAPLRRRRQKLAHPLPEASDLTTFAQSELPTEPEAHYGVIHEEKEDNSVLKLDSVNEDVLPSAFGRPPTPQRKRITIAEVTGIL